MGTNFHTPWDTNIIYKPTSMNPALADIDKAITYLRNVIVHCDGLITYNKTTGVLTWANVIRIHFNRADGQAILNTVAAGNITLADGEFAYVDLNETNGSVLTVAKAAVATGVASNFLIFNRLVLGYRNTVSDEFFSVYLRSHGILSQLLNDDHTQYILVNGTRSFSAVVSGIDPTADAHLATKKYVDGSVIPITSAAEVTIDWALGRRQEITLGHDVAFTHSNGVDGQTYILYVRQNAAVAKVPTWVNNRYGDEIIAIIISATLSSENIIGFIYRTGIGYCVVSNVSGYVAV